VAVLRYLWSLKWSLTGGVAVGLLGFLSFGVLGYFLYYLAYPVVGVVYPPMPRWRPDAVWGLLVGAGILWALSFPVAGVIDHALLVRGTSGARRGLCYLLVLWLGAVAAWSFLIATNLPPLRP
jgi:hypothetical protein